MKCEKCGQENADICVVKVKGDNKETMYICKNCLSKMENNLLESISNLLEPVLGKILDEGLNTGEQMICPKCGQTKALFEEERNMGCEECYETFFLPISNYHVGKIPKKNEVALYMMKIINEKELSLRKLVEAEKYEDAALLRDEIKELKEEMNNGK